MKGVIYMKHEVILNITVEEIEDLNIQYSTNDSIKSLSQSDNVSIIEFMYKDFLDINLVELGEVFIEKLNDYYGHFTSTDITFIVRISDNSEYLINIDEDLFAEMRSKFVVQLEYLNQIKTSGSIDNEDDDEDDDEDIDDMVDIESFMSILDKYGTRADFEDEDDMDDDDEEDDNEEIDTHIFDAFGFAQSLDKKSKNRGHQSSKSFHSAKNKKANIKNHGILISSNNSIESDKRIIKAFLKKFIPGDSKYIKDYRKKVLNRWISMYALSKNQAKEIENQHRKKRRKNYIEAADIIGKTSRNLARTYSSFYDINK